MTLADKIVVLNAGRIEQIGGPMELYNSPANEFVAGFIGSPKMNFIDGARAGRNGENHRRCGQSTDVDTKSGAWKGTVVHANISVPTPILSRLREGRLITVRISASTMPSLVPRSMRRRIG